MTSKEIASDRVVQELAFNNPGLLARLLAVQGLTELNDDEQRIVAGAVDVLFSAVPAEDIPDEVTVWLNADGYPPMPSDFTEDERWYIQEYQRISPFLGVVSVCLPGAKIDREIVDVPPSEYF